jgi:hypothetical protein
MLRNHRIFPPVLIGVAILVAACGGDSPTGTNEALPPPVLSLTIRTDDAADRIHLTTQRDADVGNQLNVCLRITTASGWWKGIGANRDDPTVQGEGSALRCSPTAPGRVTFTFWKAKTFGVHTKVGSTTIDLSQYAGYRALFTWQLD